jgi:molybdopterin-containing oxidoreductase family membrane subunit
MAKVMLVTGLIVAYGYLTEAFIAWYSGDLYEGFVPINRANGPYRIAYWSLILCNIAIPQLLWFKRTRLNPAALWVISIVINIGMWLERFVIIVVSLHRDFLPSSWGMYAPSFWDYSTFLGTIGLFLSLLFLFLRFLPMISIFEMRTMLPEAKVEVDWRDVD